MKRFIEGEDRRQGTLLPELLDDYVAEDNPVRVVDVFVEELDLRGWVSRVCNLRKLAGLLTTPPCS
jgi:transposase